MRVFRGLPRRLSREFRTPIVTWGMFDGVHRGHQAILAEVIGWAWQRGAPAVALTFSRHPALALTGTEPPFITSLPHRLRLLERLGLDACVVLRFTRSFSRQTPRDFVNRVIRRRLRAGGIVLGEGAQFGRGRSGDLRTLRKIGEGIGIDVRSVAPIRDDGAPISSTRIRAAIQLGDMEGAAALLGRPVSAYGTVVRGAQRGRTLGFPTANLDLHHEPHLPPGVYGCRVRLSEIVFPALTNIGIRPTFSPRRGSDSRLSIEVHLLPPPDRSDVGVPGTLYGTDLEVEFLMRLRGERRFPGPEALKRQIERDRARFVRMYTGLGSSLGRLQEPVPVAGKV
ncbi:MAG: riboflavin biosynthesis protein RibF [Planctomycetes bacterium]|nr:riboflavin biosynthesis protein RibF [Planctomycetota bacterium]